MIFRQLFERESSTYTYLLAARTGGEAVIIDPVLEKADELIQLVDQLGLHLAYALDTHTHADHVTALGALRDRTGCITLMGDRTQASCVSARLADGEVLNVDGLDLTALYTPGHTDESFCFLMPDRAFTGDTLLIRGSGRTDFQNGDPYKAYDSLFNRLLTLPDDTLVYPGHDYRGWAVSTIGEERAWNPRLQVKSADEYAAMMNALNLPSPKLMDIAVPANLRCGRAL